MIRKGFHFKIFNTVQTVDLYEETSSLKKVKPLPSNSTAGLDITNLPAPYVCDNR
jgi:hypothetical protein